MVTPILVTLLLVTLITNNPVYDVHKLDHIDLHLTL